MGKTIRTRRFLVISVLALLMVFPLTAFAKDKVKIGAAIALSGPNAGPAMITQLRNYKLWVDQVNAKGGLKVKGYDKPLPIELTLYDDKGDVGTSVRLVEKLILKDKVDLLLPPWGTASHFAVAPIVTKHGYPMIGPTASSVKLMEIADKIPYMFIILNQPTSQGAGLVEVLKDLKVKTAALIRHTDLHGIEFVNYVEPALKKAGIKVLLSESYPMGAKDLSPLLKKVKAANPEAVLAFSYPGGTILLTKQARTIGLNPKVFFATVGVAFPFYRDMFKTENVEGIMGAGAWNPNVKYAGAKEYFDAHVKHSGHEPDRWGSAFSYAALQIMEQAVAQVGLDNKKLRDLIASETFPTVIGPVKFENQFNVQAPGEIGQWQNGEFEVVSMKAQRTAKPIYPKPAWK